MESTSTFSEGVTLRGAAFNEGLRPAVAAMGASSPVDAVQSVTRVLERSNEEGSLLTQTLCSGLSAHVSSAAQAACPVRPSQGGVGAETRRHVACCRLFG